MKYVKISILNFSNIRIKSSKKEERLLLIIQLNILIYCFGRVNLKKNFNL